MPYGKNNKDNGWGEKKSSADHYKSEKGYTDSDKPSKSKKKTYSKNKDLEKADPKKHKNLYEREMYRDNSKKDKNDKKKRKD